MIYTKEQQRENRMDCSMTETQSAQENPVTKIMKVFEVIIDWRTKHKGTTHEEVVQCPVCGGKLHLKIHKNNHVHGACETEGCVRWIQQNDTTRED